MKRRKSIVSIAILVCAGLILVLVSLLILNLWYPNILQEMYTDSNALGAVFPAIYFGIPLLISASVVCLIRLAVAISRRTGIAFSAVSRRGSLVLMLLGVLTLWHPGIGTSSDGAIITGIMLLVSGGVLFLIAITTAIGEARLRKVA